MAEVLIYQKPVALNAETHKDLCLKGTSRYDFAANVASVPLTAAEFTQAALHFPIVFSADEAAPMPVDLLGTGSGQNVFVDEAGAWTGGYLPALLRRYPFVFGPAVEDGQMALFMDEAYEGFNTDGKGERLFDADGAQTGYLQSVLGFLQNFQVSFAQTELFAKQLAKLDVLRPAEATVQLGGGRSTKVVGFQTVDREALKKLDDAALREVFNSDALECIFLHLASLGHVDALAKRIAARDGAQA